MLPFPVYVYTHRAKFPLSAFAAWAFLVVFRTLGTGLLSLLFQRQSTGLLLLANLAFPLYLSFLYLLMCISGCECAYMHNIESKNSRMVWVGRDLKMI